MLVLSRKPGQEIRIGNDIIVKVTQIQGGRVRIGVEAPKNVQISRGELEEMFADHELSKGCGASFSVALQ